MIKKRYIIILAAILLIVFGSIIAFTRPVLPFIQLPGEVYPGSYKWPIIGPLLGGFTNTFASTLVAWTLILILALSLRARSRTADEVPSGFYNFFEMIIEGAYNFAENISGSKVRDFFPYFMTIILIILVANWISLIPGWDSIGIWENKPHFFALQDADARVDDAAERGEVISEEELEEFIHEREVIYDEQNLGDLHVGGTWLIRAAANADPNAPIETTEEGYNVGRNPEAADWTIVPFFRPAASDLNFTLAFALIAMVMVQYYGFKYSGVRGYLAKFFPFIGKGWGQQVAKNPVQAIDPAVGILELISEVSKIISFAFRLLGNIFAGMVLLFVMGYLLPVINIAFFGLEFFVGLIQALVFGLLTLIFMTSATEGHHAHDTDEHH